MTVPSRSRSVLFAAVAVMVLSACGSGGTSGSGGSAADRPAADAGTVPVREADRPAFPGLDGETLDGKALDTADYRGRILVVNVWGSWCGPCRAEADHLVRVSNDLADDGVRFIGINTRDARTGPALAFEKNHGIPYPSLRDPAGKLLLRFPRGTLNVQTIPTTVFVDRKGRIAGRIIGGTDEERLRKMLDPLLAE
ncbi:TlpA family protein disulfide reductase [Streptomyces sp. NPDC092952]|uniref:TlpA family protein disulfide reductase n=1 Tax=Streptomyces sp. NPDC092952 TaxID=3366018 RepID=UPI003801BF70